MGRLDGGVALSARGAVAKLQACLGQQMARQDFHPSNPARRCKLQGSPRHSSGALERLHRRVGRAVRVVIILAGQYCTAQSSEMSRAMASKWRADGEVDGES